MTVPDPDAVQVLARALHTVGCLRGARGGHTWSQRHHEVHTGHAKALLAECANGGAALVFPEHP